MVHRCLFLFFTISILIGCNSCDTVKGNDTTDVHIRRFDRSLYDWVLTDAPVLQQQLQSEYASMLRVIGLSIFKTQDTQTEDFFSRMINYYSEPTLSRLYRDALKTFDNVATIEADLGSAFGYLQNHFPTIQIPAVYMHVSGFNQNVLVDDSLLSISIDKYLGADYPLYDNYFYAYERRKMDPVYIAPDYFAAWVMSEYPFQGDDRVLLDQMIYEGKIKYLIHEALPKLIPETLMGYTPEEYQWCKENEKIIWEEIIQRKHLYTPDHVTTSKYFSSAPTQFISDLAPGNLGAWIGWQIVSQYMNRNRVTPEELMNNTDAQDILTKSKYKP